MLLVGEVYFAPAHEPPTIRGILDEPLTPEPSPWVRIGTTDEGGFASRWVADYDEEHPIPAWESPLRTEWSMTLSIAAAFDVPLHLLGVSEPDHRRDSVRVDYWLPTLDPSGPWKRPGLTGRRYRIARRRYARARRDWIRRGRPHTKHSTFIPTADITMETP